MLSMLCKRLWIRNLFHRRYLGGLAQWEEDLTSEIKRNVEKHWREDVLKQPMGKDINNVCYILSMFPYPSGQLHMGHVRVYSLSDSIARFHRLSGKKVIHPMGWDAFGLPAENAAIERNVQPAQWTSTNINIMKKQLSDLGFKFDWEREIATCDSNYYQWTQYIFLKLFEKGLAYQKKAVVNWDPVDQTVLADEQVDDSGCSWRSGAKVEKKLLKQWYIKTTSYAKQLFDGLDDENLKDWKDIINLQKHWIGECNGLLVKFSLKSEHNIFDSIDVWTERPEKILFAQFIAIKPDSLLCTATNNDVANTILPIVAVNPLNKEQIPIVVVENLEYPEGKDVYVASPKVCSADADLAMQLGLNMSSKTLSEHDLKINSKEIIQDLVKMNVGVYPVSSKLKDWLISRQRYWGTPIPIVHCDSCGAVSVPYEDLPVELPENKSTTLGSSQLSNNVEWLNCKCPKCGSNATRETDTMDTFVDSSWYFLRYLDPLNDKMPFDSEKIKTCFPVNLYIGGKEHAVLHLYYSRFITHFLHSLKWISHTEPFKQLLVQGMVMGKSYRVKSSGKYLPADKVIFEEGKAFEAETGEVVETQWEKMSKSKYNGENPQNLLEEYGCDTTRLFMLADVTPATYRHWSDATFPGILNWQHRLWLTIGGLIKYRNADIPISITPEELSKYEDTLWESRNHFTSKITYHFKHTHHLSIVISRLQGLTTALRKVPREVQAKSKEFELALCSLIIMLSPLAPHFSCELWSGLQSASGRINAEHPGINWAGNVLEQRWPVVDDNYHLALVCKVDGAVKSQRKVLPKELADMTQQEALELMLEDVKVSKCVKRGIARTVFDNHKGTGATLNIITLRSLDSNKDKKQLLVTN